jgi:hypothetical protein
VAHQQAQADWDSGLDPGLAFLMSCSGDMQAHLGGPGSGTGSQQAQPRSHGAMFAYAAQAGAASDQLAQQQLSYAGLHHHHPFQRQRCARTFSLPSSFNPEVRRGGVALPPPLPHLAPGDLSLPHTHRPPRRESYHIAAATAWGGWSV